MMYIDSVSQKYSIAEARAQLPRIVEEAEAGAEIELTRRGQPVAVLVSPLTLEHLRQPKRSFAAAFKRFRRRFPAQMDFDSSKLRDKSPGRKVAL